jgi:hypothetical protein
MSVARTVVVSLLAVAAAFPAFTQPGSLDPMFESFPFAQWFERGGQAHIAWAARVSKARLSIHQRLSVRVSIRIEQAELAKRRGRGQLLVFFQFTDAQGHPYQCHGTIDLEKISRNAAPAAATYPLDVFVVPGTYRVSVAILDTATGEHSAKQMTVRVPRMKNDPLPGAWDGLPPVAIILSTAPPDGWFLPAVGGRLHLPAETRRPLRIEVVGALTPNRDLGALLAAVKTISQVEPRNGSLNVALLDLSRQRVTFRQDDVRDLDWPRLRDSLTEADPGMIDQESLKNRRQAAQFFVTEIARTIGNADGRPAPCVLIVLGSPVVFGPGHDLEPIPLASTPERRIFYIRHHAAPGRTLGSGVAWTHRVPFEGEVDNPDILEFYDPGYAQGSQTVPARRVEIDQLAPMLKPLAPRVFDIDTPEQFRKALATILAEISRI